ncbi:DUF1592 domain-containing protein [Singulisphaera sp. PoT]|uniref:DUF1592 domain-containing protein n=1 Tax=Singulisphaera sp. PoT TaxID=3411797 RepID=UPI003BF5FD14
MRSKRVLTALTLCSAFSVFCPGAGAAEPTAFDKEVKPVLEKHCIGCHGALKAKAGIDLSRFKDEAEAKQDPELWTRVADAIHERTMPPKGRRKLLDAEVVRSTEIIEAMLESIEGVQDPGRGPIQRLTREQYNNTIRDILGVDTRPADAFPTDGGGGAGFDNNASTLFVPPILMEKYLAAATDVLGKADPGRYLVARPDETTPKDEAARRCIERFASRAFRRPSTSQEVDRLLQLFKLADGRGRPFEESVRLALRAVLVSPSFLFLVEQDQPGDTPYRVSEYELASRLSYFLWSSMPDDALFDLAAKGMLHEPAVLEAQVKRMLADPKSRALAKNFAGQWLRVNILPTIDGPDRGIFPDDSPQFREAMAEEAIAFFHALLRDDRPVLDLIGADYTYLNEAMAKHYGIEGVTGPDFRRVELKDPNRGGVLGMAAILTLTSYPQRTSPVLRGKWVLEEILGTPPPPPPPNVKVLSPEGGPVDGKTFRQRLEMHRGKAECASCHAKLDPLGFGLERFDPVGRLRDKVGGLDVDDSGELASGEKFRGAAELKKILKEQKRDLFVRNLTRRMLSYALKRGVEFYDANAVREIDGALADHEYRSTVLVSEIVKSYPFQYRRNESPPKPGAEAKP